ncbi:ABC transporter substrate-binding protein [Microbacterium aquimaris]|uniref:Extracellular solute-binding protein n=1 Tax=Microbacterium aquimaris TaxID=459816 RepID=A0ABU5N2Q2_9MICO|nr:extracellular solute-binding protein [Microbacterium aquimaris]MDZ8160359.1 extracellular solute-binding protein [Microbacterium aquimaris]
MRRKLITAVAATATLGLLAGCSGTDASDDGTTTITFMIWDNGAESIDAFNSVAEAFTESTDGEIVVEVETLNTSDYDSIVETRLSGGSGPDVYGVKPDNTALYVEGGFLSPVQDQAWFQELSAAAQDAPNARQGDDVYTFPLNRSGEGLIYNTDLFEEAGASVPTTLPELLETSQTLLDAGITPLAMSAQDMWWQAFIIYHASAQNVDYLDPEFNQAVTAGETTFSDNDGWMDTIEVYEDLMPYFMPDPLGTSQEAAQSAFLQGEVAMFPASWILPEVRSAGLNVDYATFPTTDEYTPAIWGSFNIQLGINPENGNADAANQFVEYLYSDEPYTEILTALRSFPVKDGIDVSGIDPLFPTMLEAWDGVEFVPTPSDFWNPGVQDAMNSTLQDVLADRADAADVLAAMDTANDEAIANG